MSQAGVSGRFALFRETDFVRLWVVGGIGEGVRWMQILAMSVYAYDVTGSVLAVTAVNFLRSIPLLLFGAVMGALADRMDGRRLLVLSVIIPGSATLAIGVLGLLGVVEVWHIGVAAFANGLAFTAEMPVRRSMLAEVAGQERLAAAMGFDGITRQAMRAVGPALGGFFLQVVGLHGAYLVAMFGYVLCLPLILRVAPRPLRAAPDTRQAGLIATTLDGLRYVRREPAMIGFLVVCLTAQVLLFPYASLLAVMGREVFNISPFEVGLLAATEGSGALVGALLAAMIAAPRNYRFMYIGGSMLFAAGIVAYVQAPGFALAAVFLFATGMGVGFFSTMQATLPQYAAVPEMRSRIMGLISMGIGISPFGLLHVGLLAEYFGPRVASSVIGLEALFILTIVALRWRGKLT